MRLHLPVVTQKISYSENRIVLLIAGGDGGGGGGGGIGIICVYILKTYTLYKRSNYII